MPDHRSSEILQRLEHFRSFDAPIHGGRIFSYVYDSGRPELDTLAGEAVRRMQGVNGLDPTTYPSVALIEKEILEFSMNIFHAKNHEDLKQEEMRVFGSITNGGTASCLLAVKTARDLWRTEHLDSRPKIVAPSTVHAAFHKAAHYFELDIDLIPVDSHTKQVSAADVLAAVDERTAIVVLSAPNYPYGLVDPVSEVAADLQGKGISLHVDACLGGFILPWWDETTASWDFAVPGVTSLSADLHKFGYAPKGSSVLLQRGHHRHRAQYFATNNWPGYPVVNATLVGSRPAGSLAAAWAIMHHLGTEGYAELTQQTREATDALSRLFRDEIVGLRLAAESFGPIVTIEVDDQVPPEDRVDPHIFSDTLRKEFGWVSQSQPGFTQRDGSYLKPTVHFTITPVSLRALPELMEDIQSAADLVRGIPGITAEQLAEQVPPQVLARLLGGEALTQQEMTAIFHQVGVGDSHNQAEVGTVLPSSQAPLMAMIESLPKKLVAQLLIEVIARQVEGKN